MALAYSPPEGPTVDALEDPQVQAARIIAASNFAIATAIEDAAKVVKPVADAVADLNGAQKKFCTFIVKHRLKILASVPMVLTTIGAVSPNLAKALHDALLVLSAHP